MTRIMPDLSRTREALRRYDEEIATLTEEANSARTEAQITDVTDRTCVAVEAVKSAYAADVSSDPKKASGLARAGWPPQAVSFVRQMVALWEEEERQETGLQRDLAGRYLRSDHGWGRG